MADTSFDVIIIGSGPGGYVTAIRASQLGMKVAVVEAAELGGVCLNWGCIPTKAMLRSAEIYHNMQHAKDYGLTATAGFDLAAIVKRSRGIAGQLSGGVKFLMKKNKVTVITGFASLTKGVDAPTVNVDGKAYTAKHVILATGARARTIPQAGLEPDGKFIWTAREAMTPDAMPKKLLVIGSGAIGMEFASFYDAFGADVTVVEMVDRILPAEDAEISGLARKAFEKRGLTIKTSTQVKSVTKGASAVKAVLSTDGGHNPHPLDANSIPGCTYCHPQIASVGYTEAQAKEAGHDIKVGRFPFIGNGKAIALGEPEGLVKTVFDAKTGELLGAHMIGAEVTELIQGYTVARKLETTEEDLMETVFPHPTLSEMMHEAVLDAYGKTIHM